MHELICKIKSITKMMNIKIKGLDTKCCIEERNCETNRRQLRQLVISILSHNAM